MRDQQDCPGERLDCLLQLLYGRQVQVVGRFVEYQQVHPAGLQQRQGSAGAFTGRQRIGRPRHVVTAQTELGEQGTHVGLGEIGDLHGESVGQWGLADEQRTRLIHLTHEDSRAQCSRALVRGDGAQE